MYIVYIVYAAYHVGMEIKTLGTREFRDQISQRVDAAHFRHEPTIVSRNGEPRAVLIAYAEWRALQPTETITPPSQG